MDDVETVTRVATAVAARDTADWARALVELVSGDFEPGDLIDACMGLRASTRVLLDRASLTERAAGATWEQIADGQHLTVDEIKALYGDMIAGLDVRVTPTLVRMRDGGFRYVAVKLEDVPGLAQSIDQWRERHLEPWDTHGGSLAGLLGG